MAMDYLSIQATSVLCEQVFLSAKKTNTLKQNKISPVLIEALQLYKFSLKKECLNFMAGWLTRESALMGDKVPADDALGTFLKGNENATLDHQQKSKTNVSVTMGM
jgi:hypothetical protein